MLWYIVLFVVGAALTLTLHELSHAIVVWRYGGTVTGFYPWPHMHDGQFYFGRMTYIQGDTPINKMTFTFAPLLKATIMVILWFGLAVFVWKPFYCLYILEELDYLNWFQGYIRRSKNDGGQFRSLC